MTITHIVPERREICNTTVTAERESEQSPTSMFIKRTPPEK